MTDERMQELRQLLNDAIENLEIRRLGNKSTLLPVAVYRERLRQRWTSRSDDSLILMGIFEPHILNKAIESKLLACVKQEFALFIHEDRILSASRFFSAHPGAGYPLIELLRQLLNIAIVRGVEEAVLAVARCTEDSHGPAQYMALLEGIRLESEVHVSEAIRLVPLPASTTDLPRYLPHMISQASGLSESFFCSKTLIIIDYFVSPVFHHPLQKTTAQEHFNKKTRQIQIDVANVSENVCQALSLACNSAVQIILEWRFMSGEELFNLSGLGVAGMSNKHNVDLSGSFTRSGVPEIKDAKLLYHVLANLASGVANKLRIPVDRWIKSKTDKNPVDKMIDLGIAFESLYLSDIDVKTELSFRLRLHASWHLGENEEDRKALMAKFRTIYDCRSDAVHKGKLDKMVRFGGERITISKFITEAQDLCRQSILKILEDGQFPEWNSLILGDEAESNVEDPSV